LPFQKWLSYPIVAMLPWKGCVRNCVTCGGSAHFYRNNCGRRVPAYRSPDRVADDISGISRYSKGPIIILGDVRQGGAEYAANLLGALRSAKVRNHVAMELYYPADRDFLNQVALSIPNFNIEISPESHDEEIRRAFGRSYSNESLERTIADAFDVGCKRVDLFFMTGLPKQTAQSVRDTARYVDSILAKFNGRGGGRIVPYITPLAPFLDPGSLAFEEPEKYGYKLFYRSLEEHRRALLQPSWKYMLNFETVWMSRDEMVQATYDAAAAFTQLKAKYGLIGRRQAENILSRIAEAKLLLERVDAIIRQESHTQRGRTLDRMRNEFARLSGANVCGKRELWWPFSTFPFNPFSIARALLSNNS
jgi:B12-binding domain/radical SAM domain protein